MFPCQAFKAGAMNANSDPCSHTAKLSSEPICFLREGPMTGLELVIGSQVVKRNSIKSPNL